MKQTEPHYFPYINVRREYMDYGTSPENNGSTETEVMSFPVLYSTPNPGIFQGFSRPRFQDSSLRWTI